MNRTGRSLFVSCIEGIFYINEDASVKYFSINKKLKSFTIKPKFLSKYYSPTVSQDVIASDVEASMDVWQEIKTFYPDTAVDDIKNNIINLLNNQKQQ